MADTRLQGTVEDWIAKNLLASRYGGTFTKRSVPLVWGGSFEFDAVGEDSKTVVCISTSCCRTTGGKPSIGKYNKIRSDALHLLNAVGADRRILVFTDREMFEHCTAEQRRGRFPTAKEIELGHVELPAELSAVLLNARQAASAEVSPATSRRFVRQVD